MEVSVRYQDAHVELVLVKVDRKKVVELAQGHVFALNRNFWVVHRVNLNNIEEKVTEHEAENEQRAQGSQFCPVNVIAAVEYADWLPERVEVCELLADCPKVIYHLVFVSNK